MTCLCILAGSIAKLCDSFCPLKCQHKRRAGQRVGGRMVSKFNGRAAKAGGGEVGSKAGQQRRSWGRGGEERRWGRGGRVLEAG